MRCCEHYNPSSEDKNHHDGVSTNGRHKFDKLLPYQSCTNSEVLQGSLMTGCPFVNNQGDCGFYSPEELSHVKAFEVVNNDSIKVLSVKTARVTYGIREYYVIEEKDDNDIILGTFNAHELGEDEAKKTALQVLENLVRENKGVVTEKSSKTYQKDNEHSYLLRVVNA